jgi:hypothetical protein
MCFEQTRRPMQFTIFTVQPEVTWYLCSLFIIGDKHVMLPYLCLLLAFTTTQLISPLKTPTNLPGNRRGTHLLIVYI